MTDWSAHRSLKVIIIINITGDWRKPLMGTIILCTIPKMLLLIRVSTMRLAGQLAIFRQVKTAYKMVVKGRAYMGTPNVLLEVLIFLLRIWEVSGSYLGPKT